MCNAVNTTLIRDDPQNQKLELKERENGQSALLRNSMLYRDPSQSCYLRGRI